MQKTPAKMKYYVNLCVVNVFCYIFSLFYMFNLISLFFVVVEFYVLICSNSLYNKYLVESHFPVTTTETTQIVYHNGPAITPPPPYDSCVDEQAQQYADHNKQMPWTQMYRPMEQYK